MTQWASKWSEDQREAMAVAYLDRKIPAKRVAQLAAAGELQLDGVTLPAFEPSPRTVNDQAYKLRKRRRGELKSGLTDVDPRDAVEALRRRLISAADHELQAVERLQKRRRDNAKTLEAIRQVARATREIAAIPARDEPRPIAPGQRRPGTPDSGPKEDSATRGGLAGAILTDHRRNRDESATRTPHTKRAAPAPSEAGNGAAQNSRADQAA